MTNITAGPLENQTITISAVSSNTALIPNPTVNYASPSTTGSISYTPALNQSGTSTITITLNDGSTPNGILNETFLVTVNQVNDPPTINDILNPNPILENAGEQIVNISGITAGGGENQVVLLSVTSANTTLIPTPVLTYLGGTTAQLAYTPTANQNGQSLITVKADDQNGGVTEKSFTVTVSIVNDPPELDAIASPAPIMEDAPEQEIILSGISPGTNENQDLTISAESSNTDLISSISIDYTNPASTGILSYTANANQFGTAIITVTVDDGSLIDHLQ